MPQVVFAAAGCQLWRKVWFLHPFAWCRRRRPAGAGGVGRRHPYNSPAVIYIQGRPWIFGICCTRTLVVSGFPSGQCLAVWLSGGCAVVGEGVAGAQAVWGPCSSLFCPYAGAFDLATLLTGQVSTWISVNVLGAPHSTWGCGWGACTWAGFALFGFCYGWLHHALAPLALLWRYHVMRHTDASVPIGTAMRPCSMEEPARLVGTGRALADPGGLSRWHACLPANAPGLGGGGVGTVHSMSMELLLPLPPGCSWRRCWRAEQSHMNS